MHFYAHLSEFSLALLVFTASAGLSFASLWIYKRLLPHLEFEPGSGDFSQIYGGAIGTIFALIFAMVIVAVWQNYDHLNSAVEQEVDVLSNIYHNLEGYPPEVRQRARSLMEDYVAELSDVEWPLMAQDHEDPKAAKLIEEMSYLLTNHLPSTLGELPRHQHMLQLLAANRTLRHDRIQGGGSYLDTSMWISLGVGSVLLMLFSCMLNMPSRRQHFLMHITLGLSLGLLFHLLLVYNYPFVGPGSISADPMLNLPKQFWVQD